MSSSVVCFASSKGGSGKTVITANIARLLSELGKKVLIIDCDAATHGMSLLYIVEISSHMSPDVQCKGVFELEKNDSIPDALSNSIVSIGNNVDLFPATYHFKQGFDPEDNAYETMLNDVVSHARENYDVVLLDAQAGSDKYSRMAMDKKTSDKVVLVSEYDPLSAAGIERLKQVVGEDLDYTRTWVLLNKILPEFADNFSEFLSISKYLPPIPWNADVVRSYAKRKLALDVEKGNVYTLAIIRILEELFGEGLKNEISKWSESKSFELKEPLKKQYANAEKELKYALVAKRDIELKAKKRKFLGAYAILVMFTIVMYLFLKLDSFESFIQLLGYEEGLLALVSFLAILVVSIQLVSSKWMNIEETAESAKYNRQIALLEERLKQLEALNAADFETIIKNNSKN